MKTILIFIGTMIFSASLLLAYEDSEFKLDNPITAEWLRENLKEETPRLFLSKRSEEKIIRTLREHPDALIAQYYQYLKMNTDMILEKPVLTREQIGRRMLHVSREAVGRFSLLALIYRIEKDEKYLIKLQEELHAVSTFSDWNPSHFLDTAEMALAVAIALDRAGKFMPSNIKKIAKTALIEKAIVVSIEDSSHQGWIEAEHNWSQVCHGGLSAAALTIADEEPELAASILSRALAHLHIPLKHYAPDGAYPEGPGYWGYGTTYQVLMINMCETALGRDFGMKDAPGFLESALYRILIHSPGLGDFNYSDNSNPRILGLGVQELLLWFANQSGDALFFNKNLFQKQLKYAIDNKIKTSRVSPIVLNWLTQFEKKKASVLPTYWKADGINPIAIFRSEPSESNGFFLGVKGGAASVNHGNMDAGSFVLDLNGIRWVVDPGNQNYHELEQAIGPENLWQTHQSSFRWKLLTKGNLFHSTLTVNDQLHNVNGFAPITDFAIKGEKKQISLDLSEVFKNQLKTAQRTFIKVDENTLQIIDEFETPDTLLNITWSLITQAHVSTMKNAAILHQNGEELSIRIVEPAAMNFSVISLNPPPLPFDKKMDNLKRLEIRIPAYEIGNKNINKIVVEMRGTGTI